MKLAQGLKSSLVTICCLLFPAVSGAVPLPLAKVPVPEPPNLSQFVKDKGAAIILGKAFFWEMQAGSDGVQACASCHFRAGADSRLTNQLNPGPATPPATLPAFEVGPGPHYPLQPGDFPFFQVFPVDGRVGIDPQTGLPLDPNTVIVRNLNDICGSQGLSLADFLAINAGTPLDGGAASLSPLFGEARQVTGRNAPSVVNAVFNYANFWDGRANNIFNGENPLGPLDVNAGIWVDDGSSPTLVKQRVAIPQGSLASQATGPPLSSVEMSFAGRSFPELGRKLLALPPLARQLVHPADSVLGGLARGVLQGDGSLAGAPGLAGSYRELIQNAFQDRLWNSAKQVTLPAGPGEQNPRFSQIEANFPLFWGLALQLYEATLVSDRTPFDRFLGGNADALTPSAQNGFATFVDKCAVCHSGSELSSAVVGSNAPGCALPDCNPLAFSNNSSNTLIRTDTDPVSFAVRLGDAGFFNIGVRPSAEDRGRGGDQAQGFPFPLAFSTLAKLPGLPFATPQLPAGSSPATPVVVNGAFKVPGLRNVELTPPYFHNGSMLTLDQVVEFYTRGGNFPDNPELAGAMQPIRNLRGNPKKRGELVDFLNSLTDERVRNETAPFDHPQLFIPSGDAADTMITLGATGGSPPEIPPSLSVAPVSSPTLATTLLLSGSVAPLSTVEIRVNSLPPLFASVSGSSWSLSVANLSVGENSISFLASSATGATETQSATVTVLPVATIAGIPPGGKTTQTGATLTIGGTGVVSYRYSLDSAPFGAETPVAAPILLSGLSDAVHSVSVLATDAAGNQQPATNPTTASWVVKANPPLLTLAPPSSPTRVNSQSIGGSVELGVVPTVFVDTAAQVGPVSMVSGNGVSSWSCTLTGLSEGGNNLTVTARDLLSNSSTVSGVILLDTIPPALSLDPVPAVIRGTGVTLTGTVEAGLTPRVAAGGALAGPVTVSGGSWSCALSALAPGQNQITVTAGDPAGNVSSRFAVVEVAIADGNFKGSGVVDISDALTALRIAVGLLQPSAADLSHGDVAPLVNGLPAPDGRIDLSDALLILRKVVGLTSF
jgi:cytochrome c peroxidase